MKMSVVVILHTLEILVRYLVVDLVTLDHVKIIFVFVQSIEDSMEKIVFVLFFTLEQNVKIYLFLEFLSPSFA
jgi:hypothetical protein